MSSDLPGYKSFPLDLNPERTRTLPDEILASIFELCLPTGHDYSHHEKFPLTRHAPICVTHVCSRWRKIAVSNSKLWSVLYLGTRDASKQSIRLLKDILAVWEERSRYRPMSISILLMPSPKYGPKSSVDRGLRLHGQAWASLLPQLSQLFAHCKWLEIGHATGDVLHVIEDSSSIQELVCFDEISELTKLYPRPTLSKFLRLHSLKYRVNADNEFIPTTPEELLGNTGLSSTKLRKLFLAGHISTQSFVMLATAIPTLEKLNVKVLCAEGFQDLDPSLSSLASPNVSRLQSPLIDLSVVVFAYSPIIPDFQYALNDLSFPRLRYLYLGLLFGFSSPIDGVLCSIASALHHSQSPMQCLLLSWNDLPDKNAIKALLCAVPRLALLYLYSLDCECVEVVVRAFMMSTTDLICPHLHCISFKSTAWLDPKENARSLLKFISSRFAAPANELSRLVFESPVASGGDDDDISELCAIMTGSAQFEMYREQGLEIQTVHEC